MSFTERNVPAINPERTYSGNKGINVSICIEEERKVSCVQEKRTRLFTHMELEACWD